VAGGCVGLSGLRKKCICGNAREGPGLKRVLKSRFMAKKRTSAAEAALQMHDLRHGFSCSVA
jgi:hypothetical protein